MNQFDDIIKRKLESEQISLNPDHLSGFEKLLDQEKRKDRGLIYWISGGLILGLAILLFMLKPWDEDRKSSIINQSEAGTTVDPDQAESTSVMISTQVNSDIPDEQAVHQKRLVENLPSINASKKDILIDEARSTQNNKQLENKTRKSAERNDQENDGRNNNFNQKRNVIYAQQLNEILKSSDTKQLEGLPEKTDNLDKKTTILKRNLPGEERLHAIVIPLHDKSTEVLQLQPLTQKPGSEWIVIPGNALFSPLLAHQIQPIRKWSIGLEGAIGYPKSQLPLIKTAMQIHIGGFIQRTLTPKISAGLSGGFIYNEGGIDFTKSSASQQFGFGLRSSVNTLQLSKAYFTYAGIEMVYRVKQHILLSGVTGKYLYGAKGDLARSIVDDFDDPINEILEDVWIETGGLRKLSLDAKIAYGYQISPKFTMMIQAWIPLLNASQNHSQYLLQDDYFIDSKNQKIIPQVAFRYTFTRF